VVERAGLLGPSMPVLTLQQKRPKKEKIICVSKNMRRGSVPIFFLSLNVCRLYMYPVSGHFFLCYIYICVEKNLPWGMRFFVEKSVCFLFLVLCVL